MMARLYGVSQPTVSQRRPGSQFRTCRPASQIGVGPALFGEYARRGETRREHLIELQKLLALRSFGLADWRACLRVGADAAWATDRGEPIIQAMLDCLRGANVLIPAAAVLERIGLAARARARKKAFEALANGLTDAARDAIERLLRVDPEVRRSRFAWLRDYSELPAPSNVIALLDRLEYVRDLGIGAERSARIHAARHARLVEEGAVMTAQHIADLEPSDGQPSSSLRFPTSKPDWRMQRSPCSRNTWVRCSPRRRAGMNDVSRPPSATWPRR